MDGNRRWAKQEGFPSVEGHRRGYEKLRNVTKWCQDLGVKELTVYAFSSENWNRAKEEVIYLLELFRQGIREQIAFALEEAIGLLFPGDRSRFTGDSRELRSDGESQTTEKIKGNMTTLW